MINIDRIAIFILFISMLLLFLPERFLFVMNVSVAGLLLGLAGFILIYRAKGKVLRSLLEGGIVLLLAIYLHYPAHHLLQLARIPLSLPKEIETKFAVEEVLHQQDYQTAIIRAKLRPEEEEQRIFLNWYSPEILQTGQQWQARLKVRPLYSRLNRGGFDRQQWYFSKGITAWANLSKVNNQSAVSKSRVFSFRLQTLQQALAQTRGLKQQGLLIALGFGERAWLDAATWRAYQRTNTAHLIAISGLHISLAMGLGVLLGRVVQFWLPTRLISPALPLLSGLGLAWLYSYLAGFSIPTSRAVLALALVCGLKLWRGYCTTWQLFIRVVGVLLLLDPLMVLSNSFWLSVGAVFSLILWYQLFPLSLLEWRGKPLHRVLPTPLYWLLGLLHLQIGLFVLFMPVQWLFFHGFSVLTLPANLWAVPLFSLLLVPLILFALFSNGALSSWQAADWLAEGITRMLALMENHWIGLSVKTAFFATAVLVALLLSGIWLIYRDSHRTKKENHFLKPPLLGLKTERELSPALRNSLIVGGLSLVLFCFVLPWYADRNVPRWQLETLDIGQGLATLIVKNNHGVLYDTGAGWRNGSMAQLEILPYLQREGIELDWLILSHDDNDHAGGAADILRAYPQARLLTGSTKVYDDEQNTVFRHRGFCRRGLNWQWQGLQFRVLSPEKAVERANNRDSCVILISDGSHSVLLTGDADTAAERQIIKDLNKIDVLQVGHHGSRTSTGEALLQASRPDIALISAARWNRWQFPHREVVERLSRYQVTTLNTAVAGQIPLGFYPRYIEIKSARNAWSPWYRAVIE